MHRVRFCLETVTPVISRGAMKNAEIRPATFKGLLRYWFRALISESNLNDLHQRENALFGSTEKSSLVGIRIKDELQSSAIDELFESQYKNKKLRYTGLKYLWYSIMLGNNNNNYIKEDQNFTVTLFSKMDKELLKVACLTLWILIHLGSIGYRNRRGAGSLKLLKIEDEEKILTDYQLVYKGDNLQEFKSFLKNNYSKIKEIIDQKNGDEYTTLSNVKVYIVNNPYEDYKDALDYIGNKFISFRRRYDNCDKDYKVVKDFILKKDNNGTVEKAGFGLPIMYRYSSLKGENATVISTSAKRRSSPLIIKVIKIGKDYYPMLVHLSGKLLPDSDEIKLTYEKKGKKREFTKFLPDVDIISKFIETLENIEEVNMDDNN